MGERRFRGVTQAVLAGQILAPPNRQRAGCGKGQKWRAQTCDAMAAAICFGSCRKVTFSL